MTLNFYTLKHDLPEIQMQVVGDTSLAKSPYVPFSFPAPDILLITT